MVRTIIDPPSGWMYGFPRELTWDREKQTLAEWLIDQGYPKTDDIDWVAGHCRYWEEKI